MKVNKFGKKFKSYTEAVKLYAQQTKAQPNQTNKVKTRKDSQQSENQELFMIVQSLNAQVKMLNSLVTKLCGESIEKDGLQNKEILLTINNEEY